MDLEAARAILAEAAPHDLSVLAQEALAVIFGALDEIEAKSEFDGVHYLRLALTRTRADQATVTFRRQTLVQAVRQFAELAGDEPITR